MSQRAFDLIYRKNTPGSIWTKAIFYTALLIQFGLISVFAQNRSKLETRRLQLIEEIDQTNQLLAETKKNKATTLDRYFALQNQIRRRQELIQTLRQEISYADSSINRAHEVIQALNLDVTALKQEYAQMLRTAFRHKMNQSYVFFLFSAKNFNDAFKRWRYILQYDQFRKRQAELITDTQRMLSQKLSVLEVKKQEKQTLLDSEQLQKQLLTQELANKNQILTALKQNEQRLTDELSQQQRAHQELNTAIESVIVEEMARKRRSERSAEALAEGREEERETIPDAALSDVFQSRKGRLPWPVSSGIITRYFGTQPHPTQKKIQIVNNGIDIQSREQAPVQAVFDGTVAGTQFIPGYQHTVIVQHGTYYTVYSNLEEIYVKRGDKVNARQTIGRLSEQNAEVHFEVWREKTRLNPIHWVSKAS